MHHDVSFIMLRTEQLEMDSVECLRDTKVLENIDTSRGLVGVVGELW